MRNRLRILAFVTLACLSVGAALAATPATPAASADAASATEAEQRVVFHVDDVTSTRDALNNILSQLSASPNSRIVFLANGRGIYSLVKGESDHQGEYGSTIAELQARGVRFEACGTAMRKNNILNSDLLPNVAVVPSGVVELTRLQTVEHYAYIKP